MSLTSHEAVDTVAAPLSYAQQRMWFLDGMDASGTEYVVPTVLRLTGQLDVAALEGALTDVVARHPVLRSRIEVSGAAVVQVMDPPAPCPLPVTDLTEVPPKDRAGLAHRLIRRQLGQPFNLGTGPLLRCHLLRLAEDEWQLVIAVHHIAFDGWSRRVFYRDLSAQYGRRTGAVDRSVALPQHTYADFARQQRRRIEDGELARDIDYWDRHLRGVVALDLPADRPRPPVRSAQGAVVTTDIGAGLDAAVTGLARRHSATPFMAYLAAFAVLLTRYAGRQDVTVATPAAGRDDPAFRDVIGCFLNTLPLRLAVNEDWTAAALLTHTRDVVVEALSRAAVPYEYLVDAAGVEPDLSRTPLCQAMFIVEPPDAPTLDLPGVAIQEIELDRGVAKFDLTLAVRRYRDGSARAALRYATSLFDEARMRRMLDHYVALVERLVADPAAPLRGLPWLTDPERDTLVSTWNATSADLPDACVDELVDAQARRTPDAICVGDGERQLTYAQLNDRASAAASTLAQRGVGVDDVVGVFADRCIDLVAGALGVLRAGAAYLPLSPDLPDDRVAVMCEDSGVRCVVVTTDALETRLADIVPQLSILNMSRLTVGAPVGRPPVDRSTRTLAYVIYTSGSTGSPKGVAVEHRSIGNRLEWMRLEYGITGDDVVLHKTPFGFDVSIWELFLPLIAGARLVLARPDGHGEPAYLAQVIEREGVTTIHFVPSMLRAFLAAAPAADLTSLRRVICSGEALPAEVARNFAERFGCELHNLYGPTEAAVDVTAHHCRPDVDHDFVPIGRPIANVTAYVTDADLRPVPVGVPGELLLGGVQLARGYLNHPDLTAERFIPDHLGGRPGGRLYRTGDIVRWRADGSLVFVGRADRQVKIRGMRVELGEIEASLVSQPAVSAAVVTYQTGPAAEPWLVGHVVAAPPGAPLDVEAVRADLAHRLPGYMVPSMLVVLPRLPTTANGKLDSAALAVAGAASAMADRAYVAPRSRAERLLAGIWQEVLRVDRVGVTDNFFELGGNSLLAVLLTARIREELHRSLPVTMLLQKPTIAELAAAAGDEGALRRYGCLVPLRGSGRLRPMFFIHSHGGHVFVYQQIAHSLNPERPVFALRAQGLDDDAAPFEELTAMAAYYVSLIREIQPHGPYALAGWCFGGAVALEMAKQLRRDGELTDPLGIISLSAVQEMPDWEMNDDEAFLGFVLAGYLPDAGELPALAGHRNVPLNLDHMRTLGLEDQLRYVMREARARNVLRPDVDTPEEARRLFEVYRAHRKAILDYPLTAYEGRVVLFKAERNHLPDTAAGDLGWGPLALGGLEVREIPGTHFQLLQDPNVRVMASVIEEYLSPDGGPR